MDSRRVVKRAPKDPEGQAYGTGKPTGPCTVWFRAGQAGEKVRKGERETW